MAPIDTATAAFLAGLATSPHCVGMCGPIGCAMLPVAGSGSVSSALVTYHLSRIAAYTAVGAAAGLASQPIVEILAGTPARVLPWAMLALFLVLAFRLDRLVPKPGALGKLHALVLRGLRKLPKPAAGALLGGATPLLPCGPLYLLLTFCLFAGSAAQGAQLALSFGLGTIPLLWLAQTQYFRWSGKLGPLWLRRLQVALALGSAALIAWRLLAVDASGAAVCH